MPCLHKDLQEASKLHLLEQEEKSQNKIRNTQKKIFELKSGKKNCNRASEAYGFSKKINGQQAQQMVANSVTHGFSKKKKKKPNLIY